MLNCQISFLQFDNQRTDQKAPAIAKLHRIAAITTALFECFTALRKPATSLDLILSQDSVLQISASKSVNPICYPQTYQISTLEFPTHSDGCNDQATEAPCVASGTRYYSLKTSASSLTGNGFACLWLFRLSLLSSFEEYFPALDFLVSALSCKDTKVLPLLSDSKIDLSQEGG